MRNRLAVAVGVLIVLLAPLVVLAQSDVIFTYVPMVQKSADVAPPPTTEPTATATVIPPTATATAVVTATPTPLPPTPTSTPVPPTPTDVPPTPVPPTATPTSIPQPACDPSYPDFCIPPPPPDLNCTSPEIGGRQNFRVFQPDPHRFDGNKNGIGCES